MSLMAGQRPEENDIINLKFKIRKINPNIVTLPQLLKNNGYEIAAVGKIFDPRNVESRTKDDPISWTIPYQTPKASLKDKDQLVVKSVECSSFESIKVPFNFSFLSVFLEERIPFLC